MMMSSRLRSMIGRPAARLYSTHASRQTRPPVQEFQDLRIDRINFFPTLFQMHVFTSKNKKAVNSLVVHGFRSDIY
jgi:hypothetical protein